MPSACSTDRVGCCCSCLRGEGAFKGIGRFVQLVAPISAPCRKHGNGCVKYKDPPFFLSEIPVQESSDGDVFYAPPC